MHILVIEDHQPICFALENLLDLEGYQATCVESGELGLKLLESKKFDLILLDLSTNGMSALQFVSKVKELLSSRNQPFPKLGIFSGNSKIEIHAREMGADFLVRKPFSYDDLLKQIEDCFVDRSRSCQLRA